MKKILQDITQYINNKSDILIITLLYLDFRSLKFC